MKISEYEDWYDNGPGSENFKREMGNSNVKSLFILRPSEDELEYLRFFRSHSAYVGYINEQYETETGKRVPIKWIE